MSGKNHAVIFFLHLKRIIQDGHLSVYENNPKILLLNSYASAVFLVGRDVHDEPYLGVPSSMMPWFTELDWVEASICRKKGYLIMEVRDTQDQELLMGFGIKIRPKRLNIFCVEGVEDVDEKSLNIKVFEQDKLDPTDVIFADQNEYSGIVLKEIVDFDELSGEFEAEEARLIMEQSGMDKSFTQIKIKGR